jgi:hypothetical protein
MGYWLTVQVAYYIKLLQIDGHLLAAAAMSTGWDHVAVAAEQGDMGIDHVGGVGRSAQVTYRSRHLRVQSYLGRAPEGGGPGGPDASRHPAMPEPHSQTMSPLDRAAGELPR